MCQPHPEPLNQIIMCHLVIHHLTIQICADLVIYHLAIQLCADVIMYHLATSLFAKTVMCDLATSLLDYNINESPPTHQAADTDNNLASQFLDKMAI